MFYRFALMFHVPNKAWNWIFGKLPKAHLGTIAFKLCMKQQLLPAIQEGLCTPGKMSPMIMVYVFYRMFTIFKGTPENGCWRMIFGPSIHIFKPQILEHISISMPVWLLKMIRRDKISTQTASPSIVVLGLASPKSWCRWCPSETPILWQKVGENIASL